MAGASACRTEREIKVAGDEVNKVRRRMALLLPVMGFICHPVGHSKVSII
jgi:hypothetical protein